MSFFEAVAKGDIHSSKAMAYALKLPSKFKNQLWKVKIRDRECTEPPHATVLHKTRAWRIDLRNGNFLDKDPPPGEVPDELVAFIRKQMDELIENWDRMYPGNPVWSK